jgi:Mlc titration factor MtfA (ptsG expression regulator)
VGLVRRSSFVVRGSDNGESCLSVSQNPEEDSQSVQKITFYVAQTGAEYFAVASTFFTESPLWPIAPKAATILVFLD